MGKKAKVSKGGDGYQVRFERILNHDIDTVWDAITNIDKLRMWFTDFEMDYRPGGDIRILFRNEDRLVTHGKIVKIDPPHRFEYTWEGDLAVWELSELPGNKCKLVLTYSKVDEDYLAKTPSGFQILLDRLEKMLQGNTDSYPFGAEDDNPELLRLFVDYARVAHEQFPDLKLFQPIVVEKKLQAPVTKVWAALTEADLMEKWYFKLEEFKAETGFKFSFPGVGNTGNSFTHLCEVLEVISMKKLQYSWQYEDYVGYSVVTFELTDLGEQTHLKLTHEGLETFPNDNPDLDKNSFGAGWSAIFDENLVKFLAGANIDSQG